MTRELLYESKNQGAGIVPHFSCLEGGFLADGVLGGGRSRLADRIGEDRVEIPNGQIHLPPPNTEITTSSSALHCSLLKDLK